MNLGGERGHLLKDAWHARRQSTHQRPGSSAGSREGGVEDVGVLKGLEKRRGTRAFYRWVVERFGGKAARAPTRPRQTRTGYTYPQRATPNPIGPRPSGAKPDFAKPNPLHRDEDYFYKNL
jgi:hypothetical protein